MGRSRSPSPSRRRDRSRDRSRERDRERRRRRSRERRDRRSPERDRARSRDRDLDRHRDRDRHGRYSRSRSREKPVRSKVKRNERPIITEADLQGKTVEEQQMMRTMGFCGFDTTKGKKVDGNDVGAVHVILKRKYRQYMNRKGGFNRPLDFVA
ncbi:U4/U6.U5 small nuclear ribonucleoprotein 27 kDa protein [Copidosoma floridanum]|uniref:U4/U6.U5 small nuclear ribonucleoprotein 27 kDa protein n=1 Tax=Copidosoma floridanum TaxID=29053 RepID=UPI0006C982F6|nr:U4/U6.U5 small nuclear ribonucleoprotein 27 kDa protein [Copidosoma floridanum]